MGKFLAQYGGEALLIASRYHEGHESLAFVGDLCMGRSDFNPQELLLFSQRYLEEGCFDRGIHVEM